MISHTKILLSEYELESETSIGSALPLYSLLPPIPLPLSTISSLRYKMSQLDYLAICHIQVHLSGNNVPTVKPPLNHTSPPFLQHVSWQCCNPLDIPSSMAEILLFNSVFHNRVTPISVSTLKPPLGAIGVLPLKPRASPIISVCI